MLAKVTRDRIMVELHERWPEYEFAGHKGYVTPCTPRPWSGTVPAPSTGSRYVNVRRAGAGRCWSHGCARMMTEDVLRVLAEEGA